MNGIKCCFTFYEDDTSQRLYGTRAYPKAGLDNTLDVSRKARKMAPSRAVLSDCGRVYTKTWNDACRKAGISQSTRGPTTPDATERPKQSSKKSSTFPTNSKCTVSRQPITRTIRTRIQPNSARKLEIQDATTSLQNQTNCWGHMRYHLTPRKRGIT